MARNSDNGRTVSDLLFPYLQKFGLFRIVLTIVGVFVTGWLVAHFSAEPCRPVKLWGLFEYTKPPCNIEEHHLGPENGTSSIPPPRPVELGDNGVLARWGNVDNCLYKGTEISTSGNVSRVNFLGFDEVKEIDSGRVVKNIQNVQRQDLNLDDRIYVEFAKNRPTWVPATVLRINGNQVHAKLDTAIAKTCGIDRQSVSVHIDKVIVADR